MTKLLFLDIDGVLTSTHAWWAYPAELKSQDERLAWFRQHRMRGLEAGTRPQGEQDDLYPWHRWDPAAVAALNRIVTETGCQVVVSSSWRVGRSVEALAFIFETEGARCHVASKTRRIFHDEAPSTCERGYEILDYVEANHSGGAVRFAILDDDSDMAPVAEHFFKIDRRTGLTQADADDVIAYLNQPCTLPHAHSQTVMDPS